MEILSARIKGDYTLLQVSVDDGKMFDDDLAAEGYRQMERAGSRLALMVERRGLEIGCRVRQW